MAVLITVYSIKSSPEAGKVTAIVIVHPSEFTSFRIEITINDKGSQALNLQEVRGYLQEFSQQFPRL